MNPLIRRLLVLVFLIAAAPVVFPAIPTAAAQPAEAALERAVRDAHDEAVELLRTGNLAVLRSYTRAATDEIAGRMAEVRSLGVTLRSAGEPELVELGVDGDRATAVTTTRLEVTYFGLLADSLVAEITWHLMLQDGRWLVNGVEIEL